MRSVLIVGSGPAAAGAALALLTDPEISITIVDLGLRLEKGIEEARDRLASGDESSWSAEDLETVQHQPVSVSEGRLPQKRTFGSDYPFRDLGQQVGLRTPGGTTPPVVSAAFGGFSNVWGAQTMPFSRATFDTWPISLEELEPHYAVALAEMNVSGEDDALGTLFPHIIPPEPLPPVSERTRVTLDAFERDRDRVESLGITVGHARLALRSSGCTRCGLCMTGCPHQLIYSSSQTFDRLIASGRVTYRSGLLVTSVAEDDLGPLVRAKNLHDGTVETIRADRVFLGCGGLGTTRLVLGSLGTTAPPLDLLESVQFLVPAASVRPVTDLRGARDFTLNQFNMVYDDTGTGLDLVQVHFYPNNPAMEREFPQIVQHSAFRPLRTAVLGRLSVGLGYLPSWASPKITVRARSVGADALPELDLERRDSTLWPPMLRRFVSAMAKAAPALDLWPVAPMISVSKATKSYHFGGTFPLSDASRGLETDRLGRLERWNRIHLIDASTFPSVPATTFTLTIMANVHRIATESMHLERSER